MNIYTENILIGQDPYQDNQYIFRELLNNPFRDPQNQFSYIKNKLQIFSNNFRELPCAIFKGEELPIDILEYLSMRNTPVRWVCFTKVDTNATYPNWINSLDSSSSPDIFIIDSFKIFVGY